MKTEKQRWYRKWDLDMSKEAVKAIIDAHSTPESYNKCIFDGPYTAKDNEDLLGKTLVVNGEGRRYSFRIAGLNKLFFSEDGGEETECYAHVKTLDGEIYFINHLVPYSTARQITLVADMVSGQCTVCDAHIGTENSNRDVGREFIFGKLEGSFSEGAPHSYTSEMTGRAIVWDYGDGGFEVKHIYNSNLFYTYAMDVPQGAWMATNPADYIKVRDNIYIFSFVEERQPGVQMFLLIYLDKMHDVGSCWGIGAGDRFFSACVGAKGRYADVNTIY